MNQGDLFDLPDTKRWFTIPAYRPFLDDLARGLNQRLPEPHALADALVLVPTRRGARALADAFVRTSGNTAVLLPQIRALGDLDEGEPPFEPGDLALELPPAISPLRRRFELARLILEHAPPEGRSLDAAGALELADALGQFLDAVEIEEPVFREEPITLAERVDQLVEGDFAHHWRRSAKFLAVATREWPKRLADLGLVDVATRRVKLLRLLGERWDHAPPKTPLIAAGSTGTTPAAADLLAIIARAPQGCVVLPGLDKFLAGDAWDKIDDQHPQGALKRLLDRHKLDREQVRLWPAHDEGPVTTRGRSRQRIINEALRPAQATADWLRQIETLAKEAKKTGVDPVAEGLDGLTLATARTEEEAATAAALLLREALETPEQTCALVTPDQALARRVSAKLSRWGVEADSSAGAPLARFPTGVLLNLVARASVDPVSPKLLLGILKHPFVRLGLDESDLRQRRSTLERLALRGPRPRDWAALHRRLDKPARNRDREEHPEAAARRLAAGELARTLEAALAIAAEPFAGAATAPDATRALTHCLEVLCTAEGSPGSLWSSGAGESAATLLAGLMDDGAALPAMGAAGFEALLGKLLEDETVRTGGASHPRLRILGAIEARLVRADRLVLAGLEEGVWPQASPIDPFLSRPMRKALGLPPPERRIGLSAHDFAQAACAPNVVLLHTERRGGQPSVQSRWLWRLDTLAKGADVVIAENRDVIVWADQLDAPSSEIPRYAPRPAPTPSVDLRPRSLYVTRVERWLRDPYAIYAQRILRLEPMERPDESAEARARGNAVHNALHQLVQDHPHVMPEEAATIFEAMLLEHFDTEGFHGATLARERPNVREMARFIVGWERKRRVEHLRLLTEQTGSLTFEAPFAPFTVKARADRLEILNGGGAVLDFKTGQAPTKKQIQSGFSPQLTLTGAILAHGGFDDAGAATPISLTYVRVTGRRKPGETIDCFKGAEAATLSEEALAKLKLRVAKFDEQSTAYPSWAAPQYMLEFGGDYDHLARVWEWAVMGEDETIVAPVA
ncbi:MAG TPA: double-strand break repair protein AddB [Caulobacteraceae bacterium]